MSNKKTHVDFMAGFRSMEEKNATRRHPPKAAPSSVAPSVQEPPSAVAQPRPQSRYGKVAISAPTMPGASLMMSSSMAAWAPGAST